MFSALSLLALVIGAGLIVLAVRQRQHAVAAWEWPTVMGIIRTSAVVETPVGPGGAGHVTYLAKVQYDYVVKAVTYHGDCISDGLTADRTRDYPGTLALRYASESGAQVHYDPTNPARAVLEIRPRGAGVAAGALGALLFIMGGASAAMSLVLR